jgi:hypothetical protein
MIFFLSRRYLRHFVYSKFKKQFIFLQKWKGISTGAGSFVGPAHLNLIQLELYKIFIFYKLSLLHFLNQTSSPDFQNWLSLHVGTARTGLGYHIR